MGNKDKPTDREKIAAIWISNNDKQYEENLKLIMERKKRRRSYEIDKI